MTNEDKKMGTYLIGLVTDLENKLNRVSELSSQLKQEQDNFKNNIIGHTKALEEHAKFVRELKHAKVELSARPQPNFEGISQYYDLVSSALAKNRIYKLIMIFSISISLIGMLAMIFTYKFNVEAKSNIQEEYRNQLLKEYSLISQSDKMLFDDMHKFFQKNPKTKDFFIKFKNQKKR